MRTRYLGLALALCATPASADFYQFDFQGWVRADEYARGSGVIETDRIALGVPVFVRSGGITFEHYNSIYGPTAIPYCNNQPWTCVSFGVRRPLSILSVSWTSFWNSADEPGLWFLANEYSTSSTPTNILTRNDFLPLTLRAVPGPVAGAGLPALAMLAFWRFFRRRGVVGA